MIEIQSERKPVTCAFCGHPIARTRCKNPLCRKPWQGGGHSFPRKLLAEAFIPAGKQMSADDAEWLAFQSRLQAREATLKPADVFDDDRETICVGCEEGRWIPAPGIHCVSCLALALPANPHLKRWWQEEDEIIREGYGRRSIRELQEHCYRISGLPRTETAIRARGSHLVGDGRANQPYYYTVRELAEVCDITPDLVYEAHRRGLIRKHGMANQLFFAARDADILAKLYPPAPFERRMTTTKAAKLLGYNRHHVGLLARSGAIRAILRGKVWTLDADHVEAIAREMRESGEVMRKWGLGSLGFGKRRQLAQRRAELAARRAGTVTLTEAARRLGVGNDKIAGLVAAGRLSMVREHVHHQRISEADIEALLRDPSWRRHRRSHGKWLKPDRAAELLGISRADLRDLLRAGILRGRKASDGSWRVERAHVEELAQGGKRALIAAIDAALKEKTE